MSGSSRAKIRSDFAIAFIFHPRQRGVEPIGNAAVLVQVLFGEKYVMPAEEIERAALISEP
jgi:hypothetical protein